MSDILLIDPENKYGYYPSLAAGAVFLALFSILSIAHLGVTIKSHVWWTIVVFIGGLCEILGWAGRTWAAKNADSHDAFLMQEVLLIIAPCFYSAAIYGITGMLIRAVGPEFSILRPHLYLWLFCSSDFISIIIQAAGGAMAGTSDTISGTQNGTHTMVAGIVFQLVCTIVYLIIALLFLHKARSDPGYSSKPNVARGRVDMLVVALGFATLVIIIRGIYRTIELAEGWTGYLITHEKYFLGLDGVPCVLAMLALLVAQPVFSLPEHMVLSVAQEREMKEVSEVGRV